jgi:hypothetical protein
MISGHAPRGVRHTPGIAGPFLVSGSNRISAFRSRQVGQRFCRILLLNYALGWGLPAVCQSFNNSPLN